MHCHRSLANALLQEQTLRYTWPSSSNALFNRTKRPRRASQFKEKTYGERFRRDVSAQEALLLSTKQVLIFLIFEIIVFL